MRLLCILPVVRNLQILQRSGEERPWQEKSLCLGSSPSCGTSLTGHILGFGEDELGKGHPQPAQKDMQMSLMCKWMQHILIDPTYDCFVMRIALEDML